MSNDPAEITSGFQRHWGGMFGDTRYSSESVELDMEAQDRLLNTITRKLSPEESTRLDMDLSQGEFAAAIRSMRASSAPGPDGFTAAFYQVDPDTFGAILREVFRYQLRRGELLPHQRHSSVILLFKKGDRAEPGNYRPITLMPVEVKILSRVLTNRLRPFMDSLVHPDQKGFIPGRSIHEQVILVRDLQVLMTSADAVGLATFLDFAKAYDRVNRPYLFRVMDRQGFGPNFLAWIRLMYTDAQCSLMINGWAQDPLLPSRGVKQGDPLSPFLFCLSLEPLGNLLRDENDLGIPITPKISVAVAFFADDTVLLSRGVSRLQVQLHLVDCYCAGSGGRLNHSKSVIMSLNNHREAPQLEPLHSLAHGETVRYLGFPFGNFDTSTLLARQLDRKILTRLRLWKGRARTLLGRRLIAQAVIWYFTCTMLIPTRFLLKWQGMLTRFILYNRVSENSAGLNVVPKGLATLPPEDDGIGVPVVITSIRRQHFMMLQHIVQVITAHHDHDENLWYLPLVVMLKRRFREFIRPWSGVFLLIDPPKPPLWKAYMLPRWWRYVLREWHRL